MRGSTLKVGDRVRIKASKDDEGVGDPGQLVRRDGRSALRSLLSSPLRYDREYQP
jgi:hypothetical protein